MIYPWVFPKGYSQPSKSTNMSGVWGHTGAYKPNEPCHYEFNLLDQLKMINFVSQPTCGHMKANPCSTLFPEVWSLLQKQIIVHGLGMFKCHTITYIYFSFLLLYAFYSLVPRKILQHVQMSSHQLERTGTVVFGWQPEVFLSGCSLSQ